MSYINFDYIKGQVWELEDGSHAMVTHNRRYRGGTVGFRDVETGEGEACWLTAPECNRPIRLVRNADGSNADPIVDADGKKYKGKLSPIQAAVYYSLVENGPRPDFLYGREAVTARALCKKGLLVRTSNRHSAVDADGSYIRAVDFKAYTEFVEGIEDRQRRKQERQEREDDRRERMECATVNLTNCALSGDLFRVQQAAVQYNETHADVAAERAAEGE